MTALAKTCKINNLMQVTLFKNVIGENRPGMGRYADELLKRMPEGVKGFMIKATRMPFFRHYLHKEFIYPYRATGHQAEVNHISDHSYAGLLRLLDVKRTIITCHDLIPLERDKETSFLGQQRFKFNIQQLPKAVKIIAVSSTTKASILKFCRYPANDIHVVHNGVSTDFRVLQNRPALKQKHGMRGLSILHVGSFFPRKNVECILRMLSKDKNINFIKVGPFSSAQRQYIRKYNFAKRILHKNNINNDELIELYNIADIFIMPSFAEGFGMPVLEAMACGCPVICSDIKVFRELYGNNVLFFNPSDPQDLKRKVNIFFNNASLREELIAKGFQKAATFSWQRCAEQTYNIYEQVYKTCSRKRK